MPLAPIMAGMPFELQSRFQHEVGDLSVFLSLEKILPQFSKGLVSLPFGDLRRAAPKCLSPIEIRITSRSMYLSPPCFPISVLTCLPGNTDPCRWPFPKTSSVPSQTGAGAVHWPGGPSVCPTSGPVRAHPLCCVSDWPPTAAQPHTPIRSSMSQAVRPAVPRPNPSRQ